MTTQCPASGTTRWAHGEPINLEPSGKLSPYKIAQCWDCGGRFELEPHRCNSDRQVLPIHAPEPKP